MKDVMLGITVRIPRSESRQDLRTGRQKLLSSFATMFFGVAWVCTSLLAGKAVGAERPNVLILLTDDQRADTIGALGNPDIFTPNLDELARRGCNVQSAYCLGANTGAVCLPSRNMLLSGRTYFRWTDPTDGTKSSNNAPPLPSTLPAVFKSAGYETYHHGKRGNTAQLIHRQFDHSHYLDDFNARWSLNAGQEIIDDAIGFLGQRQQTQSPWLMYLAFATPHDPRMASPEALAKYRREEIKLPANVREAHPFDNGAVLVRDEWTATWPRTDEVLRDQWHDYYAVISTIDANIGRLIAELKRLGEFENTIIVLSSDHGLAMGSHGLMGKQNLYEAGYKAPMVIAGPGVKQGSASDPVYLMDLFPTLCELTGIMVPEGLDGRSFASMVTADAAGPRDAVLLSYTDTQRAVRMGDWKLIRYPKIDRNQLFDLSRDPDERFDLADDPANSDKIDALLAKLRELQIEQGDRLALTVDQPGPGIFTPPVFTLIENAAPPLEGEKPGPDALHSTTVVGWTGADRGTPFTVMRPERGHFVAIAIGVSRSGEPKVVTGIRFDLIGNGGRDQDRSTVIVGDPASRWMPLLDQLNPRSQPVGVYGTAGHVIDRLGLRLANREITPAIGGDGGDSRFEIEFGRQEAIANKRADSFRGFHGTIADWNGSPAIESLGLLFMPDE